MKRLLGSIALVTFHALFVRPMLLLLGVRFRRRNLVPEGPCLLVGNHNSHLDAPVLMTLFPLRRLPRVHPVAAADYFGETWLRKLMAFLFMNAITIQRRPQPGKDPLEPVADRLRAGETLVFFPEGSRGTAGVVAPFRTGIGRLVQQLPGLLVVPVYISGVERIWARGQTVPVPSSIDVAVGKPRTYDPRGEAAAIAAQVRRDVLALAPPPPPVPGPRPAPPKRIAICSTDLASRRAVFRAVVERLGRLADTTGVSDPVLQADRQGLREVAGGIAVALSRSWLAVLAGVLRTGGWYRGSRFAGVIERARVDEVLNQGRDSRFVVGDGQTLVDLAAWSEAHQSEEDDRRLQRTVQYVTGQRRIPLSQWWRTMRRTPSVWLLNVLDLARPPVPDVLVLLHDSPERAMARIRAAGHSLEPHENEAFLGRWQAAYGRVSRLLSRRWKVTVLEYDSQLPPDEVAGEVRRRVEPLVERADPVGPRP